MSSYRIVTINGRGIETTDSAFFADIRYDVDDSAPVYIGLHVDNGADTADTGWKIYKFTYASSKVTRVQLAYGAWDNRATLF